MAKERRLKRVMVSLTDTEFNQLTTLAKVEAKPPAVVVREILADYLVTHKKKIDEALLAADAYHASLKNLSRQISLFTEDDS